MNLKKAFACALSCAVFGASLPYTPHILPVAKVLASEEAEFTEGTYGALTYKNYGDHIEISDCDDSATEVEIPEEIDGLPVTVIGYDAIARCHNLTTITIPNSITSIGHYAFGWCTSLTSIYIPDSVISIGSSVFTNCESLKTINVDINNAFYSSIDGVLFDKDLTNLLQCPLAKSGIYTIPDTVTNIEDSAFKYCSSLTSVIIPDSVISIARLSFLGCTSLVSVSIGNNVDSIGERTFYDCSSLKSITIPNSVTYIGDSTFTNCTSLTEINVKENNEYYSSENGVLFNKDKTYLIQYPCGKNGNYTIPAGVTGIKSGAFSYSVSLTSVTIPDTITSIPYRAFWYAQGLTNITIPNSVTLIDEYAFDLCLSLDEITFLNPNCQISDYGTTISTSMDTSIKSSETIYGYTDSTAQTYAEKYGRNFVALNGDTVTTTAPTETVYGDADGDGEAKMADVVKVTCYASNAEKFPLSDEALNLCDVYQRGDGVDTSDALSIQKLVAQIITELPESVL